MPNTTTDKVYNAVTFSRRLLADYQPVPVTLLRRSKELGIVDGELTVLLRALIHILPSGEASVAVLAREFSVAEEQLPLVLSALTEKGLLAVNEESGSYLADGLLTRLYELWAGESRTVEAEAPRPRSRRRQPSAEEREQTRQVAELYHCFEKELGRNLAPLESQRLREWLADEGFTPELIRMALERAVLNDKRNFSYIYSILRDWQSKGFTTREAVEAGDVKPEQETKKAAGRKSLSKEEKQDKVKNSKFASLYEKAYED